DLGLDEVPTYSGPQDLAEVVAAFRADPEGAAELSRKLTAIVRERHTYAVRAEVVTALLQRPRRAAAERSPLLAWTALLREEYRAEQFAHADLQVLHHDLGRELGIAHRRIQLLETLLDNQPGRRLRRYFRYLTHPRALGARLRASRAPAP